MMFHYSTNNLDLLGRGSLLSHCWTILGHPAFLAKPLLPSHQIGRDHRSLGKSVHVLEAWGRSVSGKVKNNIQKPWSLRSFWCFFRVFFFFFNFQIGNGSKMCSFSSDSSFLIWVNEVLWLPLGIEIMTLHGRKGGGEHPELMSTPDEYTPRLFDGVTMSPWRWHIRAVYRMISEKRLRGTSYTQQSSTSETLCLLNCMKASFKGHLCLWLCRTNSSSKKCS